MHLIWELQNFKCTLLCTVQISRVMVLVYHHIILFFLLCSLSKYGFQTSLIYLNYWRISHTNNYDALIYVYWGHHQIIIIIFIILHVSSVLIFILQVPVVVSHPRSQQEHPHLPVPMSAILGPQLNLVDFSHFICNHQRSCPCLSVRHPCTSYV